MNIVLTCVGKTNLAYLQEGIQEYEKRLKHYNKFTINYIPDLKNTKNLKPNAIKSAEGQLILSKNIKSAFTILLDENGKEYTSVAFAQYLQKLMLNSHKNVHFIIGGAYGFSQEVYQAANTKMSLSKMTFSHQMIRLLFVEQLYRAFTILNNEPYHHQ